jgi:hypothetical protein
MHSAGVGGGGGGCHRGEGAVGAGVGFQAGVPSLVDAQVAALRAAVVAQGALVGLLPRVRTLVDPHLPVPAVNDAQRAHSKAKRHESCGEVLVAKR